MRRYAALVAVFFLVGCAHFFAPPSSPVIVEKLTAASAAVHKVAAAAELGTTNDPVSYNKYEETYISTLANLRAANAIAKNRAAAYEGTPAASTGMAISGMIQTCESKVKTMAAQHKKAGITSSEINQWLVEQDCDIALRGESKLKELGN